jgi:hypothetical protein
MIQPIIKVTLKSQKFGENSDIIEADSKIYTVKMELIDDLNE